MIYLDNAATSLQKPKEVEEAVIRAFHTMGNPDGAHMRPRCRRDGVSIPGKESSWQNFHAEGEADRIYLERYRGTEHCDFGAVVS